MASVAQMAGQHSGAPLQDIFRVFVQTAAAVTQREFKLQQALHARLAHIGKLHQSNKLQLGFIQQLAELFLSSPGWPVAKDHRFIAYLCFTAFAHTFGMANEFAEYTHAQLETELFTLLRLTCNTTSAPILDICTLLNKYLSVYLHRQPKPSYCVYVTKQPLF